MTTEADIRDYYDRRHRERGQGAWRPPEAFPHFLDVTGAQPGRRMLDVGCGTGFLLKAAVARGLDAFGVDISEEAVRLARQAEPKADIRLTSGERLPFDAGAFDYVFCLGALEHFIDMKKGMMEMVRVARADAWFCIVVPNVNFLYWAFSRTKGTEQQDINERLLSMADWTAFFRDCGLEAAEVLQDRWWFLHRAKIFASPNPVRWARAVLSKLKWLILPLNRTYQFIFILRKAPAASGGRAESSPGGVNHG